MVKDTLNMIDELRKRGAVEVEVDGVKAKFAAPAVESLPKAPKVSPKSPEQQAAEDDEILFASAGG